MGKSWIDECPECHTPIDVAETVPQLLEVLGDIAATGCAIATCRACGHLIAVGLTADLGHVEGGVLPRDWFLEWHSEEVRHELHEAQEQEHHKKGRWG